jgi:hypothetical protein
VAEESSEERTPESVGEALKREALRMAIEYHARSSQHPNSRGPARPSTVTATAETFVLFLREAADRAGIDPDDV